MAEFLLPQINEMPYDPPFCALTTKNPLTMAAAFAILPLPSTLRDYCCKTYSIESTQCTNQDRLWQGQGLYEKPGAIFLHSTRHGDSCKIADEWSGSMMTGVGRGMDFCYLISAIFY
jgi:hypothetical protein